MIDLMVVLLIFYMSFASLAEQEVSMGISVPTADQSKKWKKIPGEVILNMPDRGKLIVAGTSYTRATLIPMLSTFSKTHPNVSVVIRARRDLSYQEIGRLLNTCVAAGVWNISFACMESNK